MHRWVFYIAAAAAALYAQPVVNTNGIRNAASARQGLPNPAVAQGALFVIQGRNLGPAEGARWSSDSLTTELGGTLVKVTAGGSTYDAPILYTTANEVAALLPADTPTGEAMLSVTYNSETGNAASFQVVPASFGVFTVNRRDNAADIYRTVAFQGYVPLNDLEGPLKPGDEATLWGSGLGNPDGEVEVLINDRPAAVVARQRADCCAGLERIVFVVPEGVEGCSLPVTVKTSGVTNLVAAVSVAADGRFCPDRNGFSAEDLAKAQEQGYLKAGYLFLLRYSEPTSGQSLDLGWAGFSKVQYEQIREYRSSLTQAIPGACYLATTDQNQTFPAATMPGLEFFDDFYPFGDIGLDAGPVLNLNGPGGTQTMESVSPGYYSNVFINFMNPLSSFLTPGDYTLDNGGGGADVEAFRAQLRIDPAITFTNVAAIQSVQRSQDLKVTWTGGGPNDRVMIVAMSGRVNGPLDVAFGIATCYEQASKGQLTIPSSYLSQMPAANNTDGNSVGILFLYSTSLSQRFQPSAGLDAGYVLGLSYSGKPLTFE